MSVAFNSDVTLTIEIAFDSDSFARKINKLNEEMEKKYNTEDLDSDVEGCIDEETK